MTKRIGWAVAAPGLLAGAAQAGMVTTFDASGAYSDGSILGGTVTIAP